MSEVESVLELYQQLTFSAAILGGFALTFLSVLLTAFDNIEKPLLRATAFMAGATVLLVVATLGATLILISVKPLGLTFNFAEWPSSLIRSKYIVELSFLTGIIALLAGIGQSGFCKSKTTGYITACAASFGVVLLLIIFLPTF